MMRRPCDASCSVPVGSAAVQDFTGRQRLNGNLDDGSAVAATETALERAIAESNHNERAKSALGVSGLRFWRFICRSRAVFVCASLRIRYRQRPGVLFASRGLAGLAALMPGSRSALKRPDVLDRARGEPLIGLRLGPRPDVRRQH